MLRNGILRLIVTHDRRKLLYLLRRVRANARTKKNSIREHGQRVLLQGPYVGRTLIIVEILLRFLRKNKKLYSGLVRFGYLQGPPYLSLHFSGVYVLGYYFFFFFG